MKLGSIPLESILECPSSYAVAIFPLGSKWKPFFVFDTIGKPFHGVDIEICSLNWSPFLLRIWNHFLLRQYFWWNIGNLLSCGNTGRLFPRWEQNSVFIQTTLKSIIVLGQMRLVVRRKRTYPDSPPPWDGIGIFSL